MSTPTSYCIPLEKRSLLYRFYAYIDTDDYLADQLFMQNKVRVYYTGEFGSPDEKYRIIMCKVRKKDNDRFLEAISKLPQKMLLCGNTDYFEYCEQFCSDMGIKIQPVKSGEENGSE